MIAPFSRRALVLAEGTLRMARERALSGKASPEQLSAVIRGAVEKRLTLIWEKGVQV